MMGDMRTVVTIEVPIEHRFAAGELIYREEKPIPGDIPPWEQRSVWRVLEVGCFAPHVHDGIGLWDGPWYRLEAVNEFAKMIAMEAHGRVAQASTPLIDLMGPVTERVRAVDRQCERHAR
jgi:hypothetical protein